MRQRCEALRLPVVRGHGDLKPSNVMRSSEGSSIDFIDFELAGCHYRGYDLFKLFRTSGDRSPENMRAFLQAYLRCRHARGASAPSSASAADSSATTGGHAAADASALAALELDELQAEANAAEPLTWLEAAVFFLFAICVYPSQAADWRPLATSRWEAYMQSASIIDADGAATRELLAARAKRALARGGAPDVALAPP